MSLSNIRPARESSHSQAVLEGPMDIKQIAAQAKKASIRLAAVNNDVKNEALTAIARSLELNKAEIVSANRADMERSKKENLAAPLLKRLRFDEKKIKEACEGLEALITLQDPVGVTLSAMELDDGLELFKVSSPLGVIGVIFESRPDALVQISSLCLKSGNAVLLKGGSEAVETNRILAKNINSASVEELKALPGVGEVIAKRIVDYRSEHGKFDEVQDIMKVKGIGEKTFEKMKDLLAVSSNQ